MRSILLSTVLVAGCILAASAQDYEGPRKLTNIDGSRTTAVHLIPLLADDWEKILPTDAPARPVSTKTTCGDCHDYRKVALGWHFNSSFAVTKPGRPSEPWVLTDDASGTQIPISYRDWPGVWNPKDVGLTSWDFVRTFGPHLPGGDMGENPVEAFDPEARWEISGNLEIQCMACHNGSARQDQSQWAIQMMRENFRWAGTAAAGLGAVDHVASRLPVTYDFWVDRNVDNAWAAPPEVRYDNAQFDRNCNVFFDVTTRPSPERCYFCHSTAPADVSAETVWHWGDDVHMNAGLVCTDCHRNGIGHDIVRGYEGESDDPAHVAYTCRGCHLAEAGTGADAPFENRIQAPRPLHRGLPAVHLEKLTCTACHSRPLRGTELTRIKTARANRLGVHGKARWDKELPYIYSPVYVREADGRIAPHEMMWPSFWGLMKGDDVTPLPLDTVKPIAEAVRLASMRAAEPAAEEAPEAAPAEEGASAEEATVAEEAAPTEEATPAAKAAPAQAPKDEAEAAEMLPEDTGETAPLTEDQVIGILQELAAQQGEGEPVYVSNGRLYRLDPGKTGLAVSRHPVADARSWPFAHDVVPASQALGAGGCSDCHADDSGFFHAVVTAETPTPLGGPPETAEMHAFEQLDPGLVKALDSSVRFRLYFIGASLALAGLLAAALVRYGFSGLEGLARLLIVGESSKNG